MRIADVLIEKQENDIQLRTLIKIPRVMTAKYEQQFKQNSL